MSAIAGASAGVKDMADGSLRITIEFEPKDAKAAFELFGSRGTPVACAALAVGFAAVQDSGDKSEAARDNWKNLGPKCREALDLSRNPAFHRYLSSHGRDGGEAQAAEFIKDECELESRKDLDASPAAYQRFHERVVRPFQAWRKQTEAA